MGINGSIQQQQTATMDNHDQEMQGTLVDDIDLNPLFYGMMDMAPKVGLLSYCYLFTVFILLSHCR